NDKGPAEPDLRLRGWSWFAPYHDPEKLALVTDAGLFGLYGIRQPGNKNDELLFPLLRDDFALDPDGQPLAGRAQLVHARESAFGGVAGGVLRRREWTSDRETGRKVVEVWRPAGEPLGSALHSPQVHTDEAGTMLFLVTQSAGGQPCLATAVDADDGSV